MKPNVKMPIPDGLQVSNAGDKFVKPSTPQILKTSPQEQPKQLNEKPKTTNNVATTQENNLTNNLDNKIVTTEKAKK